jgi:hypothetical protein
VREEKLGCGIVRKFAREGDIGVMGNDNGVSCKGE